MNKTILKKYANLLIKSGLNVQPKQDVLIFANVEIYPFVEMLVKEAYKAKANYVRVIWADDEIYKAKINNAPLSVLKQFTGIDKAEMDYRIEKYPCMLHILSSSPDASKGIKQDKEHAMIVERNKFIKPYRDILDNKYQWCIAGYPSKAWGKKIYPELSANRAQEKLLEDILKVSRMGEDPNKNWEEHNKNLKSKCETLNNLHLKELHYTSSNGTDLRVGLIPEANWLGGAEETVDKKIMFNPNIPSEEVFTSPKKGLAEGIVYSSKPLSYNGQIIDKFYIRFKDGKAVEYDAEVNKDLLRDLLNIDEGASYLGECALIAHDSPINNTGILFLNTLYDENASCHLAVGRGFTNTIKDYEKYSKEELHNFGINDSSSHVDFMIGTKDMKIVGKTIDDKEVVIFEDGNWAI